MESEYFETSWRAKVQQIRRRIRGLVRDTLKRYRSKRKGYTRFLTDEERRWLVTVEYDLSTRLGIPYSPWSVARPTKARGNRWVSHPGIRVPGNEQQEREAASRLGGIGNVGALRLRQSSKLRALRGERDRRRSKRSYTYGPWREMGMSLLRVLFAGLGSVLRGHVAGHRETERRLVPTFVLYLRRIWGNRFTRWETLFAVPEDQDNVRGWCAHNRNDQACVARRLYRISSERLRNNFPPGSRRED